MWRTIVGTLAVGLLSFMFPSQLAAESCNTDCHRQCRISLPPLGSFIEPTCHGKCETAKKIACAIGRPVPTVPMTPIEQAEHAANLICGAPFQTVTKPVIAACSNWNGRLDGQQQLDAAKNVLIRTGLFGAHEFNGVQIRMCPNFSGEGIAPEQGRIYIQPRYINRSLADLATLLGHEMTHIRQFRARKSAAFECDYSKAMASCNGCQDSRNWMENEAYRWETANRPAIDRAITPIPPPGPARICFINPMPMGQCWLGVPMAIGQPCFCPTPYGPLFGVAQ